MAYHSLAASYQALTQKTVSAVELTQQCLERINRYQSLNAFIAVDEEYALNAAKKADERIREGRATTLTGIPMAHKDIFCTTVMPTTCGSKMLENFTSPYSATIVQRLEQEGAVMVGKTNMDEFAMGSTNESSRFGAVKNPWDTTRVSGGSSGGSAAAVAARLVPFATGSDTGGSVRQPAAFCGISGLKPTYGLISRFGMVAYASSLDQAGIMAPSAEDIAYILPAMAGFDEHDSTSIDRPLPDYQHQLQQPLQPLRIGLPRCFFHHNVEADIQQALQEAIAFFQSQGAEIIEVDLSLQQQWIPCYYVLACAEASSNLSRYDGIRFGHRSQHDNTLRELITHSRQEGFGLEVKRRILTGTHVLSAGYFEAYYVQAQKVRRLIRDEMIATFNQVDVLLGPTTPTCAFKLGEPVVSPTQQYLADTFTVGANLAGLPALSIPAGFNAQGLPIGLQLIGNHFGEARLLQIAHCFQQQTDWHQRAPSFTKDVS